MTRLIRILGLLSITMIAVACTSISASELASELSSHGTIIITRHPTPVPTATRVPNPTPQPFQDHDHDGITLEELKAFCHPTILHGTGGCFLVFPD